METKTVRRNTLRKMLEQGKLVLCAYQHSSECSYENQRDLCERVHVAKDNSDRLTGVFNISAWEFKTSYGGAYLTGDGKYHLYTSLNSYTFQHA
jgi:hypothetical protein